jgi:outer membrane biosynthesis protein TonB
MTRAMRAVVPSATTAAERALRVGVVREGRVVEERLFRERTNLTVGSSARATFVVGGAVETRVLFAGAPTGWSLHVGAGMRGRVALRAGMLDVGALGAATELDRDARGKLVVGDTTFLFQLVDPPPPKTVPQLPLAVRGGLGDGVDWTLTVIAAFSFLLHFGIVGAMYSDWLDEPVPEVSVAGLVDLTRSLPPAAPVDVVDTAPAETPTAAPQAKPSVASASSSQNGTKGSPSTSEQRAGLMAAQARAMGMEMVGAFGGESSLQAALNRSNVPTTDLTHVAQGSEGVDPVGGTVVLNGGMPPATGPRTLQDLGSKLDPTAPVATRVVTGPKVDGVVEQGPVVGTVPVPNAEATIAKLRPSFRACYQQKGLSVDSTMAGKIVLRIDVAPNGDVASVAKVGGTGLSPAVEQCILQKVQNASFDAPHGGGAKLDVPVTFVNGAK